MYTVSDVQNVWWKKSESGVNGRIDMQYVLSVIAVGKVFFRSFNMP